MAKRTRVHSRDLQPQIATPKGLLNAARVQRFDWPLTLPLTDIDELGRKLHVGTTTDVPSIQVSLDAFDTSHVTYAYLTGYTGGTFPVSGASITQLQSVDIIGQIRDAGTQGIVNALYVGRAAITALNATFGVKANTTISYTFESTSKKELKQPVFYDSFTVASGNATVTLAHTPTYLPITSGYTLDAYRTGTDGSTNFLNENINGHTAGDYTVTGSTVAFGSSVVTGDVVWVTYCSAITNQPFNPVNDQDVAAVQGKYVPTIISLNTIPRVQAVTIKAAMTPDPIYEMGGLGVPVGYEVGIPKVTGDITVLKTDNDLVNLLTGQSLTSVETDMSTALNTLSLKVQLKDPRNPAKVLSTYYIPSISIASESDTSTVNQSVNEVFSFESTTGDLWIASGIGSPNWN